MLECIVSGSPAPAAKWFKNGKEVAPGPSHQRQHNNLAFAAVARSDEGSYTCAAETEQGTVTSANYTVNILGKMNKMRKFFWERAWTVCSRTHYDVDVPASPPQSLCLWRRVCPTRSSRPALLPVSPAWLKETLPRTSPGCSTPSPSSHRIASGSPDPHWLLMMWHHRTRACSSVCWTTGLARHSRRECLRFSQVCISYLGWFSLKTTRRSNGWMFKRLNDSNPLRACKWWNVLQDILFVNLSNV